MGMRLCQGHEKETLNPKPETRKPQPKPQRPLAHSTLLDGVVAPGLVT